MRVLASLAVAVMGLRTGWASEIHVAAEKGDLAKVKELIAADPKLVNDQTEGGTTPLHLAAAQNNAGMVQFLLEQGADANVRSKRGWTPLHWASHMDSENAARLLLAAKADAKVLTDDGKTPLQVAIREKSEKVAALLVKETQAAYADRSLDGDFADGEKARDSGQLQQAYDIFGKLVNAEPDNERYNFAYGLTCYSMKEYSRAQMAFERVLQKNPRNGRAQFEMGRCLMQMGERNAAKQFFQKALATNPDPRTRQNIEKYIAELSRIKRPWQFSGRVDIGAFRDSNVNVGPDSENISIAPIIYGAYAITELSLESTSLPTEDTGYFGSVSLLSAYDVGQPGNWVFLPTAVYYQNVLDKKPGNETQYFQLDASLRHVGKQSLFQVPLRGSHIGLGGDSLVNMYGTAPVYLYVSGAKAEWNWITTGTLEARDYTTLNDRDGFYGAIGQSVKRYFGENRNSFSMGVSLVHDFTDQAVYEYTGKQWDLGLDLRLTKKTAAYSKIKHTVSSYAEREALAPETREDTQDQFVIGLTQMFTGRWGMDVNHQITENTSTFALYQYNRDVTTVTMFLTF